jgi:hypothetical protein
MGMKKRNIRTRQGQEKEKPVSVPDYDQNMRAVDLKDQLLYTYLPERKKITK